MNNNKKKTPSKRKTNNLTSKEDWRDNFKTKPDKELQVGYSRGMQDEEINSSDEMNFGFGRGGGW